MKINIFFIPVLILFIDIIFAQIGSVEVSIDSRLLRSEEKQKIINLEEIDPLLKKGHVINMGNPHIVFFTKSLDLINLDKVGKSIETHEVFIKGVNVEIVEILTPKSLKLKFWERGAGKTLSCGSGILAASYASFINKKCSDSIKISLPIGSVKVNIKENELEIIGMAEVSYLGEYNFA